MKGVLVISFDQVVVVLLLFFFLAFLNLRFQLVPLPARVWTFTSHRDVYFSVYVKHGFYSLTGPPSEVLHTPNLWSGSLAMHVFPQSTRRFIRNCIIYFAVLYAVQFLGAVAITNWRNTKDLKDTELPTPQHKSEPTMVSACATPALSNRIARILGIYLCALWFLEYNPRGTLIPGINVRRSYRLILTRPQAIPTVAVVFFLRGNISRIKNPHMPMPNSR